VNSAASELPPHQQRQDHPEFHDQVGGGDLEGHRGGEVRALIPTVNAAQWGGAYVVFHMPAICADS
jgi:hypothetical protein